MRYGTSNEIVNPLYSQKEYFENLTDARIAYRDFLLGFRILHDAPPEAGVGFSGIRKWYVEFTKDDLVVRPGDSYSLYGRGLALNLFERRTLAFDTGLFGVKGSYQTRILRASATGGTVMYHDVNAPTRVEEYDIRAASFELVPYRFFSLAVDFVSGSVGLPTTPGQFTGRFDMPEYVLKGHAGDFDAFVSYAEKRTEVFPTFIQPKGDLHKGTGFYGSLGYTQDALGVTFEYKDYRFGIVDPILRTNPDRLTKALAIQNPPIVHKEHSFTLASRYPHVIDFGDEVGFQVDVFYTVGQLTGNLNFAAASRHYAYYPTGDTDRTTMQPTFLSESRSNSFLPSLAAKLSPFVEGYADFQYYFQPGGTDYAELALNRRQEKTPLELRAASEPLIVQVRDIFGVPIAVQYTLIEGLAAKLIIERQWVRDDSNIESTKFYNQFFSLGISQSPGLALTVRYEVTSDKETTDGRKDWTAADFGFWIGTNHNLTLTFGGDRGGLVCANGICRTVPPFFGFRASLTSYL